MNKVLDTPTLSRIEANHRELVEEFFENLSSKREAFPYLDKLFPADSSFSIEDCMNWIAAEQKKDSSKVASFLQYFRRYFQEIFFHSYSERAPYSDTLYLIKVIFSKKFNQKGYSYIKAVQQFLGDFPIDLANTSAEWRAFFENRFRIPIQSFFEKEFQPDNPVTLNFAPWTFQGNRVLPVYRSHLNIKERENEYKIREEAFKPLGRVFKDYSFVWEIIKNNVVSIFYFDRVTEEENVLHIYEINPNIIHPTTKETPYYFGKCIINGSHKNLKKYKSLRENSDSPAEKRTNPDERRYQYDIIRFLIRSGIFNPMEAAAPLKDYEPHYINLLKDASIKLQKICTHQYGSSIKKDQFDHDEKYSIPENRALDQVIDYIDKTYPQAIDIRIATFEAGFFDLTQEDNTISHIYWLPILAQWKGRLTSGTVFINTKNRIEKYGKSEAEDISSYDVVPQELINTMYFFCGLIGNEQIKELEFESQIESEKAAAISIMSRNVSHNVGSHILSYLKAILVNDLSLDKIDLLNSLVRIANQKKYKFARDITEDDYKPAFLAFGSNSISAAFQRSLGTFLNYLQERHDYIGVLASGGFLYDSSINFYESIFRPWALESHFSSNRYKEVTGNYINPIINYIALSEDFGRENIEIKLPEKIQTYDGEMDIKLLDLEIPAGISGRQAIYSILENFIRNTSKHGISKGPKREKIIITFEIEQASDDLYKFVLTDNSGNITPEIISNIQAVLSAKLIQDDGTVDESHKGIKEMQIAAAWLRGIEPHKIVDVQVAPDFPVLQVIEKNKGLSYSFFLKKPKELLFVVPNKYDFIRRNGKGILWKKDYKHLSGWDIISNQDTQSKKRFSHQFIWVHEDISEETFDNIRANSSVRILHGLSSSDLKLDKKTLLEQFYQLWLDGDTVKENEFRFRGPNTHTLPIGVFDQVPSLERKKNEELALIVPNKVISNSSPFDQPIFFRKHHSSVASLNQFLKDELDAYEKAIFVEGITGDNSTSRLLREEEITPFWCHKIRETALTRVLILDERLWRNLKKTDIDIKKGKKEFSLAFELLTKKNIDILSLENRGDNLVFLNLNDDTMGQVDKKGVIELDKSLKDYHFVSIHQGLLDRMNSFISNASLGVNTSEKAEKSQSIFDNLTQKFPAKFRHIIHSGRSKTPVLPKGTAFIQLTTLDSALSDCKYTLNQLLYSSIIETP